MKTKVMHVIEALGFGGAESMFLATAEGLQRKGGTENVGLVVSGRAPLLERGRRSFRLKVLGVPRPGSALLMAILKLYEFPALAWAMLRENPDIIYIYYCSLADQIFIPLAGRLLGKKVVIRKFSQSRIQPGLRNAVDGLSYRFCDRVVPVFRGGIAELEASGVSRDRITVIPNGKDAKSFRSRLTSREAKARLGIRAGDFVIGMVGRLDPVKNHEALIRSMPEILRARKDARLVIIGDDPLQQGYKRRLEELVGRLGLERHVLFLGYRHDISDALAAFDVFAHPSLSDACPGAVLEAMCAGIPVVASGSGGTKDILEGFGILVPPHDGRLLAGAIKKLALDSSLRSRYGRRLRERAEREYSIDNMLDSYERLFIGLRGD